MKLSWERAFQSRGTQKAKSVRKEHAYIIKENQEVTGVIAEFVRERVLGHVVESLTV